jgi:(E)-2-((N-methylformamido)methylene)succinate hydrolase
MIEKLPETATDAMIGRWATSSQGEGPPVILIHGLGMNRHMWQWQWDALTPHFEVVAYDLMGHGESDKPERRYEMSDFVEQVIDVMDGYGFGRCALVGFSLGGMIVRAVALKYPERISALGILHSAHDRTQAERDAIMVRVNQARDVGPAATIEAALERWFTEGFSANNPEMMDLIRKWVKSNSKDVYPESYRVLAEGDAEIAKGLETITCPTLVLTGEEDYGNSPDMSERIADAMPNAHAVILPGLRHMALAEDPEAINKWLVPFLQNVLIG